jgi:repressor of nif and glnA expression
MTGRSTSGDDLAEAVNERTGSSVSARTIRWHVRKLGLTNINDTLPQLVETLKKTS